MQFAKKIPHRVPDWFNFPGIHWLREYTPPDTASQLRLKLTCQ
jgi:hypothetical protein